MSLALLPSADATRSLAVLLKEAKWPSALIDGSLEVPWPLAVRAWLMLSRVVALDCVSRRNTSSRPLVSRDVRLVAELLKATYRPDPAPPPLTDPFTELLVEDLSPVVPDGVTLTRVVVPASTSRTNTSSAPLASALDTRFVP